jgi:hypothetical protein
VPPPILLLLAGIMPRGGKSVEVADYGGLGHFLDIVVGKPVILKTISC